VITAAVAMSLLFPKKSEISQDKTEEADRNFEDKIA
jgi:hypothetical protein